MLSAIYSNNEDIDCEKRRITCPIPNGSEQVLKFNQIVAVLTWYCISFEWILALEMGWSESKASILPQSWKLVAESHSDCIESKRQTNEHACSSRLVQISCSGSPGKPIQGNFSADQMCNDAIPFANDVYISKDDCSNTYLHAINDVRKEHRHVFAHGHRRYDLFHSVLPLVFVRVVQLCLKLQHFSWTTRNLLWTSACKGIYICILWVVKLKSTRYTWAQSLSIFTWWHHLLPIQRLSHKKIGPWLTRGRGRITFFRCRKILCIRHSGICWLSSVDRIRLASRYWIGLQQGGDIRKLAIGHNKQPGSLRCAYMRRGLTDITIPVHASVSADLYIRDSTPHFLSEATIIVLDFAPAEKSSLGPPSAHQRLDSALLDLLEGSRKHLEPNTCRPHNWQGRGKHGFWLFLSGAKAARNISFEGEV